MHQCGQPQPSACPRPALLPVVSVLWGRSRSVQSPAGRASSNCRLSLALTVSTELSQGCARGCDLCSEFNGCLRCSPKLFILLERNDIRQIGICLPSCPLGYFGLRNTDMNKCISEWGQEGMGGMWEGAGRVVGLCRGLCYLQSSERRCCGCMEEEEAVRSRAVTCPGNNPVINANMLRVPGCVPAAAPCSRCSQAELLLPFEQLLSAQTVPSEGR